MKHFFTALLTASILSLSAATAAQFSPPIRGKISISSLFGDYRPGHFHAGLDIRTGGKTGVKLYAADDGYIWRAATTFTGYGRVVYLKCNSGHIAVYAHLDRFYPALAEIVYRRQVEKKSYKTDIYLRYDELPVKKGMIIGYSGEAGSGGPHIHYEIRSPENKPINPLGGKLRTSDHLAPVFASLAVVQFGKRFDPGAVVSTTEYRCRPDKYDNYSINDRITVSGRFGFEINAYDRVDNYYGKMGLHELSFYFDGRLIYHYRADTLDFYSFKQSDYIRDYQLWYNHVTSHKDPKNVDKDLYNYYRLFRIPGDKQPTVKEVFGEGYFSCGKGEIEDVNRISPNKHYGKIFASDYYGNCAELNFVVHVERADSTDYGETHVSLSGEVVDLTKGTVKAMITPDILYYPETFTAYILKESMDSADFIVLRQFEIFPRFTFFKKPAALKTKLENPGNFPGKYCLGWEDINGEYVFTGNDYNSDSSWISCDIGATGKFALVVDSIPPQLELLSPGNGAKIKYRKEMAIRYSIEDNFSGLGREEDLIFLLDGDWVPAEYDPDRDLIEYIPPSGLSKGKHTVSLKVKDRCGNESHIESYFIIF